MKRGLAEALGQDAAEHLKLGWPLAMMDDTPLKAALRDWVTQVDVAALTIKANYKRSGDGTAHRKEGDFVVYLRPGERALHAHRLLMEHLDKALSHASGRPYKGEEAPGPAPEGGWKTFLL